jgi:predicted DNA-binding transcriptional regulator AlpA
MIANTDLIDVNELARMLGGVSKATIWRGVKEGRFPRPIKIGKFLCRWSRAEAQAYLDRLMAERAA